MHCYLSPKMYMPYQISFQFRTDGIFEAPYINFLQQLSDSHRYRH